MITEAEEYAGDDCQFSELVDSRNQADGRLHAARAALDLASDSTDDADSKTI